MQIRNTGFISAWYLQNQYIEHKELQAAQGVKIAAKELEKVIAGNDLGKLMKHKKILNFV